MGVVIRWVWLETIGVVSGCFPHITYISELHLYLLFFAAVYIYIYIYIRNRRGPSTDPCGTPDKMAVQFEVDPLTAIF